MTFLSKGIFGSSEDSDNHRPVIGEPYDFQHVQHVQVDPRTSTGFSGLPPEMRQVLKASGISKDETDLHPQAVLDILNFHLDKTPRKLPSNQDVNRQFTKALTMRHEDFSRYYSNLRKLGQGASGIVYAAVENETGRNVALKISSANELKDLLNEIGLQILSKHPNIVECIDAYCHEPDVCIVMELVEGGSLTDVLDVKKPMPEPLIAFVCLELLKGLHHLHSHFRIHRDIKSDNILVSYDGDIKIAGKFLCIELKKYM